MPHAFRFQDDGALLTLGLHLPCHGVDDVLWRPDVAQLDPGDLHAPGFGCLIDDREQLGIDLVAFRQCLIEVQRAHDGPQVGGRKRGDRAVKVVHLVCCLGRVEDLEEHHAIDRDHGIVLGDDLLSGDLKDLLHHVDSAADAIEKRSHVVEPRLGHPDEPSEMLDRVPVALADDLHAHHHVEQRKDRNGGHQSRQHHHSFPSSPVRGMMRRPWL